MKSMWNDCTDHLYVVESSCGHIKIGRARNVERRVREISNSCPPSVALTVLAIAENHGDWEYGLHDYLKAHRLRGEWFSAEAATLLRDLLRRGSLAAIVRALKLPTGRSKGQKMTGPHDRRGAEWRKAKRRADW